MKNRLVEVVEGLFPLCRSFDAETVRHAVLYMPELLQRIMPDARLSVRGWECVTTWIEGHSMLLRPLFD